MTRRLLPLALLAVPACAPKPAEPTGRAEAPPVAVTVAPVKTVTLPRVVSVVGTLDPFREVILSPKVDGRVLRVRHDIGDLVYPGEVKYDAICVTLPAAYPVSSINSRRAQASGDSPGSSVPAGNPRSTRWIG